MKKILSKANLNLLIIALCAMLFCGLFAINALNSKKLPTAHAESSATLKGWSTQAADMWWNLINYKITNLTITNTFDANTATDDPIDVSEAQDGSLYAYKIDNGDGSYDCVIYADVEKIYAPADSSYLFSGEYNSDSTKLSNVKTITFENNCFDTTNVTDMAYMFYNCSNLTELNVSSFDTSNVKNMYWMFSGCSNLIELDVSNFATSNVKNMESMFALCSRITALDVSNFDTSNVTNMDSMFLACSGLTEIDMSKFNTSNATNISRMFADCYNLQNLNLSSFDTSKVTDFSGMFMAETWEVSAQIFQLDINSPTFYTDVYLMIFETEFEGTQEEAKSAIEEVTGEIPEKSSLTYLNISNFTISEGADVTDMFLGQTSLQTLITPKACNVEIALPQAMIEQNTTTEYSTLSSTSNGKTLVLAGAPATPSTGFVDEQLLPALAIGIVSILSIVYIGFANQKRKFNV